MEPQSSSSTSLPDIIAWVAKETTTTEAQRRSEPEMGRKPAVNQKVDPCWLKKRKEKTRMPSKIRRAVKPLTAQPSNYGIKSICSTPSTRGRLILRKSRTFGNKATLGERRCKISKKEKRQTVPINENICKKRKMTEDGLDKQRWNTRDLISPWKIDSTTMLLTLQETLFINTLICRRIISLQLHHLKIAFVSVYYVACTVRM